MTILATSSTLEIRAEGLEAVQLFLDTLPDRMFESAKEAVGEAVFKTHEAILNNLQGDPLQSRTGALGKSMIPVVKGTSWDTLEAEVYSTSIYAPIHEYGGQIKPLNKYLGVPGGPYLNIPTSANKTAAGVMKYPAKAVFDMGGYVAKTKTGRYGVFLGGEMMFVLSKGVTIPPRLGMGKAADDQIEPLMVRLGELMLQALEENTGDA